MATPTELERLAGAVSKLRPDWTARSVRTYLETKHADRAFADLAVALVVVACDPTSTTPARIEQHGPWWVATRANVPGRTYVPGPGDEEPCRRPGHEHEIARACRACRAEEVAADVDDPDPTPEEVPDLLAALHASVTRARAARTPALTREDPR